MAKRYWLFQVMDDWFPGLWRTFVTKGVAAQHYPDGWRNEKRNVSLLAKMKEGDQIIAALKDHRFAGFGTLLSNFARSRRSLMVKREDGVFDFAERFDCDWTHIPLDRDPPWIRCRDLKNLGHEIDLERGCAVKEIDRESFIAIKNALIAAGVTSGVRRRPGLQAKVRQRRRSVVVKTTELTVATNGSVPAGAGFQSDSVERDKVARAAVLFVVKHYRSRGWQVQNVEPLNLGYDLECRKNGAVLHVEVKGASRAVQCFIITKNEQRAWQRDCYFVLALVTNALSSGRRLRTFTRNDFKRFRFTPISYMAKRI